MRLKTWPTRRCRRVQWLLMWSACVIAIASLFGLSGEPAAGASTLGTERVSVDSAGNQGDGPSGHYNPGGIAISGDGRYVAFRSWAINLVLGDTNGDPDVFVHDRETGTTELVSVDSAGNQGNGDNVDYRGVAISADGRYVAFASQATNLVPDTNWAVDVFVHDRETGITERVSVDSAGRQGDGGSWAPTISADGRYVAFASSSSNLVPGDRNRSFDVFVHDRQTGVTELVSVDSADNQGNDRSDSPAISADGRYVAFESRASNLVPGDKGYLEVFVHDRATGITERVSVDSTGNQGNHHSESPAISAHGRYVVFESWASNLVPGDTNGEVDVFVHDRVTGSTELVSVDSAGNQANQTSGERGEPAISGDGRYVAFTSDASNLVPCDRGRADNADVFVHDRQTGITELVSVDSAGNQGNHRSADPAISADGRYVAFESLATNLVLPDTNGEWDIFVHDRGAMPREATPTPVVSWERTPTPTPGPPPALALSHNWRTVTVDTEGCVGEYSSIAVDGSGDPMVSYYDETNRNLKFAICDRSASANGKCDQQGDWSTITVDEPGSVGKYTSIVADANGDPMISYYDAIDADLKFAICDRSASAGGDCAQLDDWSTVTVDAEGFVKYTSIAIDANGDLMIASTNYLGDDLRFAICDRSASVGGNCDRTGDWSTVTVDPKTTVEAHTSMAVGAGGNPMISYYDETNGNLRLAICERSASANGKCDQQGDWNRVSVDSSGHVYEMSIAVTPNGDLLMSYYKDLDLTFAICDHSSSANGTCEQTYNWRRVTVKAVDSGAVGRWTSISASANGDPVVAYSEIVIDPTGVRKHLGFATCELLASANGNCDQEHEWSTVTVDSAGWVGDYNSIVVDAAGNPMISYYDGTNRDLKFATASPARGGWAVEMYVALAGGGALAVVALVAGALYARRRWVR